MVWDLRQSGGLAPRDLAALLLRSLDLMPENADVAQFVAALRAVDQADNSGRLEAALTAAVQRRNLPF